MGIVSGDKSVGGGWYQDPSNPDIYRAYINKTAAGSSNRDYIYEFNVRTGSSNILQDGAVRPFIWTTNGSDGKQTNINNDLIKAYKAPGSFGIDVTALRRLDQAYAEVARDKFATGPQKERLNKLGRFRTQEDPPPVDPKDPRGGPNAGIRTTGANQGTGSNFPFGEFRTVENFNKNDTGYQNFKYPETIENGQDYMLINIFNYKVADVFGSGGTANINPSAILGGADLSGRSFTDSLANIRLPIPNNVSEANQTKWGDTQLNNLAAGLLAGAAGAVGSAAGGDFMTAGSYTKDTVKSILGGNTPGKTLIKQQLTLGAAAGVIKKLGVQVDAEAYRARATGTVINPNLELLFNGPSLRQFQFQYKLTPRSVDEAKQIRGIIKTFKKAMAPKRGASQEDAFFLGAPNVFQLKFMRGTQQNKYLPSIKTCALTNFSVNYTADGFYSAYYDGQPISVDIVMQFAELTPIYNDHYTISEDGVTFNADLKSLENPKFEPPTAAPAAEPAAAPAEPTPRDRATAETTAARIALQGTDIPSDAGPGDSRLFSGGTLVRTTTTQADILRSRRNLP